MKQSAIVLLSGGIDSAVCGNMLLREGYRVHGLFVDYGQAVAPRERDAASAMAHALGLPLEIRELSGGRTRGGGELIGRNALLVSAAAFELGARGGVVVIGIHAGTAYYDCSPAFLDAMGRVIAEQSDGRVRLIAPLLDWSKADVHQAFVDARLPIELSYSCEAEIEPCGRCASCLDRQALEC